MITAISLSNFQSHEKVTLPLAEGVNTIIGSSDSGKTALLRGINYVRNNRPLGNTFASSWAKDDKNKLKADFSCAIGLEDGYVERHKDASGFNGYTITDSKEENGCDFGAIGSDVPEEVNRILNLSDVNVQKQMDAPFLLSESPAEVARFLNKTIKLDLIDTVLSEAERMRKQCNKDIKTVKSGLEKTNSQLDEMVWVDGAETLLLSAEGIEGHLNFEKSSEETLLWDLRDLIKYQEELDQFIFVEKIEELTEEGLSIQNRLNRKIGYEDEIISSLEAYDIQKEFLDDTAFIPKLDQLLNDAVEIKKGLEENKNSYEELRSLLLYKTDEEGKVLVFNSESKELEDLVPETCPTCKQPWPKEKR